jgi:hypothetical protein
MKKLFYLLVFFIAFFSVAHPLHSIMNKVSGLALTAVGVGTADEVILNIQDNQSLAEYRNSTFLYNSWEVFYQTLNVVDGLVNAPGAIKSLASLVKTTMKMKFVKASSKLLKVGFYKAALGVLKSGAGNTLFSKSTIAGINGFSDNVATLLNSHTINGKSLSLTEFKNLMNHSTLPVDGIIPLTQAELDFVNLIRNSIPVPTSTTVLQKVIPISQKDAFFVENANGASKSIGGYMTTAKDAKQLDTYQKIFDGMRLDYLGSEFISTSATECVVIRFKSNDVGNLYIPRNKNNGGLLNDPALSDPYNKNGYPFTGHGFTSGKNGTLGVPEWKADFGNNLILEDGAEMFLVRSDGTEILIGRYSHNMKKFISE